MSGARGGDWRLGLVTRTQAFLLDFTPLWLTGSQAFLLGFTLLWLTGWSQQAQHFWFRGIIKELEM